jgi:hypothetical protein
MEPNDARIATETEMRPVRSDALGTEFQTTGMGAQSCRSGRSGKHITSAI